MIKVFFDHQKFSTQRYGGISRYFASIINGIKSNDQFDYILGLIHSNNHYISEEELHYNNFLIKMLATSRFKNKVELVNQLYCTTILNKNEYDILHPTYYDPYFIKRAKKPIVTTIHDMTYERLPQYFWANDPLTRNKRLSIEKADKIIAISETTKIDLLELTGISEKNVEVIYHGIDLETPVAYQPIDNLPEKYLLFVGDRSGYKNFYLLIEAFIDLLKEFPDLRLVLSGGGALGVADQELLHRYKLNQKVLHLQVNDEELNYLYKNAEVFVYPSLYEGFGLPILEAFRCGCPILLSDIECFKEVAGHAAIYFSRHSKEDMCDKIKLLITNKNAKNDVIRLGYEQVSKFPLPVSVNKTLELYKTMV
jgi:glycosyltransferase involved in cell wall biosynthesis